MPGSRTVFRICTLCEATCGIEVVVEQGVIATIRGDAADPFSRGYICPKAYDEPRCTLLVHPDDASALGVASSDRLRVASRVGEVIATVAVSDEIMPGVVSLPHGWGHDVDGVELSIAREHAGVNVNILSDDRAVDIPSGNAAFNGVPVTLTAL